MVPNGSPGPGRAGASGFDLVDQLDLTRLEAERGQGCFEGVGGPEVRLVGGELDPARRPLTIEEIIAGEHVEVDRDELARAAQLARGYGRH